MKALQGVGNQQHQMFQKGQSTERVMHLKRLLTDAETLLSGKVRDIRLTPEALNRYKAMAMVHNVPLQDIAFWEPGVLDPREVVVK